MSYPQQRLRLENRARLLRALLGRSEPRGGVPTAAFIETTSRCNLSCPMCARQLAGPEWRDVDMSRGELEEALGALAPGCELVLPFGGGEPLLHPDLAWFVAAINESGRRTELATNATLLDGRRSRDLLLAGLDTLVVSLDAATPGSYAKIRRGGDFERARAGIMAFLREKKRLRAATWVILQMVALPENRGEETLFRRQWRKVEGVDAVRIKADEVNVERVKTRDLGERRVSSPCHFPWIGPLVIRYDGSVLPCCHSWRGEPVGQVSEASIASIWNGAEMRALRRAHAEGRAAEEYPACRECQAVMPRPSLVVASLLAPSYISRRAIPYAEQLNRLSGRRLIRGE